MYSFVLFCFSLALRVFGDTFCQYEQLFLLLPTCLFLWLTWLTGWLTACLLVCLHYLLMANNKRRKQETHIKYSCDTGAEAPYEKKIYIYNILKKLHTKHTFLFI